MGLNHHHETPQLKVAFGLTAGFMIVEWVVGWWAQSLALMGDAAHMLTDTFALGLSWFAAWLVSLPKTPERSFGFHRAEILVALVSGLLIWLLTGALVTEAIGRFQNPEPVRGNLVTFVAVLGLLINGYLILVLRRRTHHAHGNGHGHGLHVRGAYLHVLGDFFGSVCAIASGIAAWKFGWYWVDPVATLVLAGLLLFSSFKLVSEATAVLMEFSPSHIDPAKVRSGLQSIPGVKSVHDLHIWSVTSGKPALSVHLVAVQDESVLLPARTMLEREFDIHHSTIQVEQGHEAEHSHCFDCLKA